MNKLFYRAIADALSDIFKFLRFLHLQIKVALQNDKQTEQTSQKPAVSVVF